MRDCTQHDIGGHDLDNMNVVIVTHGLALRLFLMRWFQWSVHDFELSRNPDNCELIIMNKIKDDSDHAWMELEEKNRISLDLPESCEVPRNVHVHRLVPGRGVDDFIQSKREESRALWRARYDAHFQVSKTKK